MIALTAVASPLVGEVAEQDVADALQQVLLKFFGADGQLTVPPGGTARRTVADMLRQLFQNFLGVETSAITDSQVLDTLGYFVFPNLVPFIGLTQSLCFRFRPYGNDPNMSIMEVMLLLPSPGSSGTQSAPPHWLGEDEPFVAAPELGGFAPFLDQDVSNMVRVQRGLKASTKPGVTLAQYEESRIRHFHQVLDEYVGS
jgi:hypothetical protein